MEKLLNTLFSTKCHYCESNQGSFCYECLTKLNIVHEEVCFYCGKHSVNGITHKSCEKNTKINRNISVFSYADITRDCIRNAKYGSKEFYNLKILSKEGSTIVSKDEVDFAGFYVVPIPLHKNKMRERGFNQAEIISNELCKFFNLKALDNTLTRVKPTYSQHKLQKKDRISNMKDAFRAKRVSGTKILLVDDILTSGATLESAAMALDLAGANLIWCYTLSRKF